MTTSNKTPPGAPSSYTRFIPREELKGFAAWNPNSLEDPAATRTAPGESPAGGGVHKAPFSVRAGMSEGSTEFGGLNEAPSDKAKPAAKPQASRPDPAPAPTHKSVGPKGQVPSAPEAAKAPEPVAPPPPPVVDVEALTKDARQSGYSDGYRDGLAALESYKQTQSAQMAAFMNDQVGALVSDLHQRLELLEAQLSGRIAGVSLELARQVVRSEISTRPEVVVAVAEEALSTILASARDVVLRLNPNDLALAHGSLEEQLKARGARVMADPHVGQGGCVVESDIASVDASVESRWARVAAGMGIAMDWHQPHKAAGPTHLEVPEGDSRWLDDLTPLDRPFDGADRDESSAP
jgi:flagellar assembly protein FliH